MERQGETGKEQAFHMDSRQKQEESGMDNQQKQGSLITDYGQITLSKNRYHHRIHLLNIIGEIEGHENLVRPRRQANMSISCLSLLPWRTTRASTD